MVEITMKNFQEEIAKEKNKIIVVDFWASWCMPCKMLSPILGQISEEMKNKNVKVVKINVDENPVLAEKFMIRNLPTVMVIKQGQIKDVMVGFRPKNDVKNFIDKNLK